MATVDEHQLGHGAHVANLARTEERIAGQHDAARIDQALRRVAGFCRHRPFKLGRLAVARDVHDAPVALEQRVDHGECIGAELFGIFGTDQRLHALRVERANRAQARGHRVGLGARAGQARVDFGIAFRLADHEHAGVGLGVHHVLAKRRRAQFAQQLGANRPRRRMVAAAGVGIEQLPRDAGGAAVKLDHHFGRAAEERLHLDRNQQLE